MIYLTLATLELPDPKLLLEIGVGLVLLAFVIRHW